MLLEEYKDLESNQKNKLLEFCKNTSMPIVLFPAGIKSQHFQEYLLTHNIKVSCFVDNNSLKHNALINGVEIISFENYTELNNNNCLFVCANSYIEKSLIAQLTNNNIEKFIKISYEFFYDRDEIDNPELFLKKKDENYQNLYNSLEDDLSKKVLDNILKFRVTHKNSYIKKILSPNPQYFEPDIYKVSESDYFVDCGAFIGDTLDTCLSITNGKIAGYYAFEPDSINYKYLKQKTTSSIRAYKAGAFSKNTKLQFDNLSSTGSKISNNGTMVIDVVPLDEILKNKKVTFIKMDIEGSEKEALIGAKNTIQQQKPTLAIAVYHKFNDIFEIPELIKSFGVNYKYYLRHYTESLPETVLYAVAK